MKRIDHEGKSVMIDPHLVYYGGNLHLPVHAGDLKSVR